MGSRWAFVEGLGAGFGWGWVVSRLWQRRRRAGWRTDPIPALTPEQKTGIAALQAELPRAVAALRAAECPLTAQALDTATFAGS